MKVDDPKVPLRRRLGGSTPDRMLAALKLEMGPLDVVREERVSELRAALAEGTYSVDVHSVARDFLREQLTHLLV